MIFPRPLQLQLLIILCFSQGLAAAEFTVDPARLAKLRVPKAFLQRIQDRDEIDRYIGTQYGGTNQLGVRPVRPVPKRTGERNGTLRIIRSAPSEAVLSERRSLPNELLPMRGFRATLAGERPRQIPWKLPIDLSPLESMAVRQIEDHLAADGLLPTLVEVMKGLGTDYLKAHSADPAAALARLGFPVDLIHWFQWEGIDNSREDAGLRSLWKLALEDGGMDRLEARARLGRFVTIPRSDRFQVSEESGQEPFGLLRIQLGGGLAAGVLPGSSIDVAGQLVEAVPDVDILASVPEEYAGICRWIAGRVWSLRRPNHLTMVSEPLLISPWAQDNGKAGVMMIPKEGGNEKRRAMLAPRYTSLNEAESVFTPGETFLLDGVAKAGIEVRSSPLLFQGGNLLAVRDPSTGRRILLLGEGEILRNVALGWTPSQVKELFRVEFGVDVCEVIPAVSYHLDFDLSVRESSGRLVAMVNDPKPAARQMVEIALERFEAASLIRKPQITEIRADLAEGREGMVGDRLRAALRPYEDPQGRYGDVVAEALRVDAYDAPTANLQCLWVATDFLQALAGPASSNPASETPARRSYREALLRTLSALETQKAAVRALGWEIVEVPSFPDLRRSLNYLNGTHDRLRHLMPAYGGTYAPLDRVVQQQFEKQWGPKVQVVPIICGESQRSYGAVHCMLCPFPKLDSPSP